MNNNLINKISYNIKYIDSIDDFLKKVKTKTVVPYQLEVQPGRIKGDKICWLTCSYCYGGSSKNTFEKLSPDRYLDLLDQTAKGPNGGINKIIFAGYATDPFNYEYIDGLVEKSINLNQIIGVHTKLIKVSSKMLDLLTSRKNKDDYITVSLDAGDSLTYNKAHNLNPKVKIFERVLENLENLIKFKKQKNSLIDISVNYLITNENSNMETIENCINRLTQIGVDSIRFTFPQSPRGQDHANNPFAPLAENKNLILSSVSKKIEMMKENDSNTKLTIFDYDKQINIEDSRSLPCFARFVFPAISYDGYLSNCSQSGAVHFRDMSLGNLSNVDFWDAYYDYDLDNFDTYMKNQFDKMKKNDCRCDRKQHTFNKQFSNLNLENI